MSSTILKISTKFLTTIPMMPIKTSNIIICWHCQAGRCAPQGLLGLCLLDAGTLTEKVRLWVRREGRSRENTEAIRWWERCPKPKS